MPGEPIFPAAALTIQANAVDVGRSSVWLASECEERDVPPDQILRLDLCLNEALANVINHGGPGALSCPVLLRLSVGRSGEHNLAVLSITDSGTSFDLDDYVPRPTPGSLLDAQPGGLGLKMMRTFSDDLDYCRVEDRNQLRITVHWPHNV
ncbi:ATP-binding protein [Synechococcus sp. Cruz-9H2]|jgi:anti-sigma regulatory factor (Ser/Thr protein kinase)|uniref:ATP-binding protein n=1 Tax=unclassified Synechococcus TaxID=2626047 RepID=UPI0020CC61FF|nr:MULTISPECIES: ATP-binding protein [unclassified Synechococcus]MCP9820544.1 ATP-binding protein [Synechococcus sp. Cruz-9H2]MCP9844819.1 ATP-binding protein [Synechococcus sp. Edmonson 11F2]MCP9856900.1 ATP-binding protein [Synechococcus sp. Cruz-9C9]MCP9864186.1 ATP-binding protein [Synechococcus sp. Cruz-7E5]MCP9871496.1 ATP-binding protein [Synechococcus sp. Cruz-7B9]